MSEDRIQRCPQTNDSRFGFAGPHLNLVVRRGFSDADAGGSFSCDFGDDGVDGLGPKRMIRGRRSSEMPTGRGFEFGSRSEAGIARRPSGEHRLGGRVEDEGEGEVRQAELFGGGVVGTKDSSEQAV